MLPNALLSWCRITFLVSTTTLITSGFRYPGLRQNTPPVFDFKREWIVLENEPIGTRVTTVRTKDEERDSVTYSIEPAMYLDGSNYFTINANTGDVFLKQSLNGKAGNDYYLFVTANDGYQTAKIEVYVRVAASVGTGHESVAIPILVNNKSLPFRPRPFQPFHAYNIPVPPPRQKQAVFVTAVPHNPAAAAASPVANESSYPKPVHVVPTDPVVNRTIATHGPIAVVTSNTERRAGGSDDIKETDDIRIKLQSNGKESNVKNDSSQKNGDGRQLDLITAFLPLLAAIAFAPIVGIVFYVLHRKCNRDARRNLMKSLSQKANVLTALETSVASHAIGNEYNRDLLNVNPLSTSNAADFGSSLNCKWEFPRHHLRFIGILGEGCFGQVWKCEATRICNSEVPQIVAVKTLKENASEKERKDLLTELEIMKILDPHANVVTLMGCCSDQEPIFLIMEYVPFGKLQTYLRDSRSEMQYGNLRGSLSAKDLTSFAYQVAKGMEYIASKGIIHRDLAARNILIGNNKTCKIADFGFARDVVASHVYERKSEGRLPIRWMAIESLYDNVFTTKSDVWSFGILMWEIITLGSTPYPGLAAEQVMKKVCEGYRLEKPDHCKREMYNIMFYCWDADANERPSFSEVVAMLDKLLISENDYIELDRFPDHNYYNIITSLPGERL